MKKILFLHYGNFKGGGTVTVTLALADFLTDQGYKIYVATPRFEPESNPDLQKHSIELLYIPVLESVSQREFSEEIIKICRSLDIDIMIQQGGLFTDLAYVKQHVHCKHICCNHGKPFWEIAIFANKLRDTPWHELFRSYQFKQIFHKTVHTLERRIYRRYKRVYRACDRYVLLCNGYKATFIKHLWINPFRNKLCAINNSIEKRDYSHAIKKKQIIFLGRLSYFDKRVDRLLEIWNKVYRDFPEWELLLVGDGEERENLEQQATTLGLKQLRFCGWSNNPEEYLASASIMCLTSTFEGWGMVLCEGQQAGAVPIAFNCSSGVKTILSPSGENGILVRPFDLDEYARQLRHLMQDDSYRQKIQENCRHRALDYDINVSIGKQWIQLLDEVLSEK